MNILVAFPCRPTPESVAEVDRLGDRIAELSAHLEVATARLLTLIREFDARHGWNTGFRSCAEWLAWRTNLELGAARERVRVARALGTLPLLSEALGRGDLSYAKVRALTRIATPETEPRLLAVGRAGTAAHVERIVRGWRQLDRRVERQEAARLHASRGLRVYRDEDGSVVVRGRLTPEAGTLLMRALEAAREMLYQRQRSRPPGSEPLEVPVTLLQQQADALVMLAEAALHHDLDPGAPGERYQVVVHVDAALLTDPDRPGQTALEDGIRVSAETSQRLACDASRVVMRHDAEGQVVEVSARTRTVPPALRRALVHRDRTCRFPGCHARVGEGHHIQHWAQGGPTTLSNLALLCRRHHRSVHEEGFDIQRMGDGTLQVRRPDGRPIAAVASAPSVPADPVEALRADHATRGVRVAARTGRPGWLGERLDVGWALDVLRPRRE